MAWTPAVLTQTTGTNGDTTQAALDMDAVDNAFIVMAPTLISYARARLISSAPSAGFTDDCLNNVVVSGGTKSATTINGQTAISNPGTGSGIGSGVSYRVGVQMPASFTFLCVAKIGTQKDGNHLFTDSASGVEFSYNNTGSAFMLDMDGAGSGTTYSSSQPLTAGTAYVLGVSYEAATRTVRLFKNSAVPVYSYVSAVAYPAAVGAQPQPFSYYTGGAYDWNGAWAMWALFNQAYGGGGVGDTDFAAAIAALKTMYGI